MSSTSSGFGSSQYASAFQDLPVPNPESLREAALSYLNETFDSKVWYDDPVTSLLKGEKLAWSVDTLSDTKDAFGNTNGRQQFASKEQVEEMEAHIRSFRSPHTDLRAPLRRIEQKLLSEYAGFLIGNQCVDFGKQDGVTEMEEATMANHVERVLNDCLLQDETDGKVTISRKPIYVSCVSNFANFLDLFRKTIRSLELGIPCVILGRSNTVQHSYRWAELLVTLMAKDGGIAESGGMLTYMSCRLDDIVRVTRGNQDVTGNLYATCSRSLAAEIASGYRGTVASTQGPNTLATTTWNDAVGDAIRISATIESSGQCTALRHCVVPGDADADDTGFDADISKLTLFDRTETVTDAKEALQNSIFDGVFAGHAGSVPPTTTTEDDYHHVEKSDTFVKVSTTLPDDSIREYWRKVVIDVSKLKNGWDKDEASVEELALWLNRHQPISLAVNGTRADSLELGFKLFERTGLVVYTVGSTDNPNMPPALTCQARPQEAEIFGEFPPRHVLRTYTKFPVYVPSSTPSYDTTYRDEYLKGVGGGGDHDPSSKTAAAITQNLLVRVSDPRIRGFCVELMNYLVDATLTNPKRGFGTSRLALWGLQRPPHGMGMKTLIRCSETTTWDALSPIAVLFFATTASTDAVLSIHPHNEALLKANSGELLGRLVQNLLVQTDADYEAYKDDSQVVVYNTVEVEKPMETFPLVGSFVSLFFPLGHIKSTSPNDEEFAEKFTDSGKWLKMLP